ncbi:coiled-coil domain-containing protein 148-like isoform X1 [Alosa alosa]|uniref:coiled-coil domain-containing protein 148-like isoform X1 n=1 Tax=Alosa alosa TaxID=278164 RepID=UPI002015350B|nr:coiled-coil domain-containing protein 148-like isoform X1 [Alosa alosa]
MFDDKISDSKLAGHSRSCVLRHIIRWTLHLQAVCEQDDTAMSGRDIRAFITNHRADDLEKLTLRLKDGLGSSKYKPVQYEQLQAMLEAKRIASQHIEDKVRKTQQAAKESRESCLLCQHRPVWAREHQRLARAEEKAELDLQRFLEHRGRQDDGDGEPDGGVIAEMLGEDLLLQADRDSFRLATVEPVWQLKEDLQYRLDRIHVTAPHHSEWEQILQQVHFVREQQEAVEDKLHAEFLALEQDLASLGTEEVLSKGPDAAADLQEVPKEILTSECPDPELSASLIRAFGALSQKYRERLQSVDQRLEGLDRHCGWPPEDHLRFQLTVGQYSPELRNHRHLYMDMLQRLYPHMCRQELNEHQRRWDWYRFALAQKRAVVEGWRRDRAELLLRALQTLEEARLQHRQQRALQDDRRLQQHVCSQLRAELQQWRAYQEEVAQLEAAIAERRREEEEERLRRQQEQESAKRTRQKEQVKQFYAELSRRREVVQRRDEERLRVLRSAMEEQARRDRERVQFRGELLEQRREDKEAQALQKLKEEEEREERLQALRNQVAVVADPDPERMMGDTKASKRRQQLADEEFVLQRPLYYLNTYTDTQIVSDPRVRIEQALRQAGLHSTPYAKELLSTVQPPRPPRRDTQSIAFKS